MHGSAFYYLQFFQFRSYDGCFFLKQESSMDGKKIIIFSGLVQEGTVPPVACSEYSVSTTEVIFSYAVHRQFHFTIFEQKPGIQKYVRLLTFVGFAEFASLCYTNSIFVMPLEKIIGYAFCAPSHIFSIFGMFAIINYFI